MLPFQRAWVPSISVGELNKSLAPPPKKKSKIIQHVTTVCITLPIDFKQPLKA